MLYMFTAASRLSMLYVYTVQHPMFCLCGVDSGSGSHGEGLWACTRARLMYCKDLSCVLRDCRDWLSHRCVLGLLEAGIGDGDGGSSAASVHEVPPSTQYSDGHLSIVSGKGIIVTKSQNLFS
eukprot:2355326-Pyramimonas_sp.AAC.2